MTKSSSQIISAILSALVIAGSLFWIQCLHKQPVVALKQHEGLGETMARETDRLLKEKKNKELVIVGLDTDDPAAQAQLASFLRTIDQMGGYEIEDWELLDPEKKAKYRLGMGLSASRFVRLVKKNLDVDAIVSFAGVPDFVNEEALDELNDMKEKLPYLIAATRDDPGEIKSLLEKKILRVAIVPRFTFPAPGPEKPATNQEWFDKYFQILAVE